MSAKTTYTVPEVPGSKRQSARPYTFALIGYSDAQRTVTTMRAEHEASRARELRWDTRNWHYRKATAQLRAGDMHTNHNNFYCAVPQYEIDLATKFIAEHPTVESYLASIEAQFEQYIQKVQERGVGPMVVLRWSMSQANAAKANVEFARFHSGLRVVPCIPKEK